MVFMADSERSADLAIENNLDAGLHLNFTQSFSGHIKSATLIEYQEKIAKFLLSNRYSLLIYNPILKNHFDYIYKSQVRSTYAYITETRHISTATTICTCV